MTQKTIEVTQTDLNHLETELKELKREIASLRSKPGEFDTLIGAIRRARRSANLVSWSRILLMAVRSLGNGVDKTPHHIKVGYERLAKDVDQTTEEACKLALELVQS